MFHWWNDTDWKTEVLAEKPIPVPLCSPKIHMKWSAIEPQPLQWQVGDKPSKFL
jgi:hypothetical protein